jgi:hypothetical protein
MGIEEGNRSRVRVWERVRERKREREREIRILCAHQEC